MNQFNLQITTAAHIALKSEGYALMYFSPPGCSDRDPIDTMCTDETAKVVEEMVSTGLTYLAMVNGEKMLVSVIREESGDTESACCRWHKIFLLKI